MAQAYEIEAYLGERYREDVTREIVARILSAGTDEESEWVRIIAEVSGEDLGAEQLAAASRDYDRAGEAMSEATETFYEAVRSAYSRGMTPTKIAGAVGLSRQRIHTIVREGR